MKQAHRFSGKGQPYEGLTMLGQHGPSWTGKITLVPEVLDAPLHWKKPRRIFVNSMSDLFHEEVPFQFIHEVFATIRQTPQHVYQILTKRPERMREFIAGYLRPREAMGWANGFYSHVWLGVSIENQATADERIPILLQTPAAVRWVSVEPLLGPVDLRQWMHNWGCPCGWGGDDTRSYCVECGWRGDEAGRGEHCPDCNEILDDSTACRECDLTTRDGSGFGPNGSPPFNWVVVGGESGPGARPMHPDWVRSLRDQSKAAGVPFFFKQWGRWKPISAMTETESNAFYISRRKAKPHEDQQEIDEAYGRRCTVETRVIRHDGLAFRNTDPGAWEVRGGRSAMQVFKVGKKSSGAELDGLAWREWPR
jgi:protein gp37